MKNTIAKKEIDATQAADNYWIVNDRVMGGHSQGELLTNDNHCIFTGIISLENNGGFSLVRFPLDKPMVVSPDLTFSIAARGDGKIYTLRFKTDGRHHQISYAAKFQSQSDWHEHKFQLNEFVPTYRGRTYEDIDLPISCELQSISLMIADKQAGSFKLDFKIISMIG